MPRITLVPEVLGRITGWGLVSLGTMTADSADQGTVYAVTNDLRILAVNTTTHQKIRRVMTWQQAAQTVPPLNAVALAAQGQQLGGPTL